MLNVLPEYSIIEEFKEKGNLFPFSGLLYFFDNPIYLKENILFEKCGGLVGRISNERDGEQALIMGTMEDEKITFHKVYCG